MYWTENECQHYPQPSDQYQLIQPCGFPEKTIHVKESGQVKDITSIIYVIGYVFVNVDISSGNIEDAVKSACAGVFLKGVGSDEPKALTDEEMTEARKLADTSSTPQFFAHHYGLEEGQKIEIISGPMLGFSGVIRSIKKTKVVVELRIFEKDVLTEVYPSICLVVNEINEDYR